MTSAKPSATLGFVDRIDEMKRIQDALKAASEGKGQLLLVRGEAGSGKTRLLEEAAAEAEKLGFVIGSGTALAESVVPYHAWKEVLEGLELETILEEAPPPKLLGLYLIASDGAVRIRVEQENLDSELAPLVDMISESVRKSEGPQESVEEETLSHDDFRAIVERRPHSSLGAIVEGQEDEAFLADLNELAVTTELMLSDSQQTGMDDAIEVPMRELLESEKYEGIDYAKDDPQLRQTRLFEHMTLGLFRMARGRSLCVAIDDLQWADPSSLALLHYVARNIRESEILLLGTYRVEEAEARPHLRDALEEMEQEELLAEMDLKGLRREDLADLAESFVGSHDLHDDFLDLLWQETKGNPLFVREVLHGLEDDEALAVQGAVKRLVQPLDELAIPERVREVIQIRLNRLPKGDRRLLDAAATCGTRFTTALVARVAGEEEERVLNGLNSIAQVHGLLRPTSHGFAFDHSAVQEVLYENVAPASRQTYHREAAEWLELAGGPLEDVAEHYYRSRSPLAVPKLRTAAEAALARCANNEAARLLGEALDLAASEERGGILELQADAFEAGARYDEALDALHQALEAGTPQARCKRKIVSVRINQGMFDDALAISEEGLMDSEDVERGQFLALQAEALYMKGEYPAAMDRAEAALAMFGESGDPRNRADALSAIGIVRLFEGRYDDAKRALLQVLDVREKTNDRRGVGESLSMLGNVLDRHGDLDGALKYHQKALRTREAIGDLNGVSASLSNIGNHHLQLGEYPLALEFYERALEISEAIGNRVWIANQTNNIASVHYHLGDLDQALEAYQRSLKMKEATGNPEGTIRTLINIGNVHFYRGDYDVSFEYYQKSLSRAEEMGHQEGITASLSQLGKVYLERGDLPTAMKVLERAVSIAKDLGKFALTEVLGSLVLGLIRSGRVEEARERAGEELTIAREAQLRFEEAVSFCNLARCEVAVGNPEEARREFSRATQLFEELGSDLDLADAYSEWGIAERDWGNRATAHKHLHRALTLFKSRNLEKKAECVREALKVLETEG